MEEKDVQKRDRVYIEESQLGDYREMVGLSTPRFGKAKGSDLIPFDDLKTVFLFSMCLGKRAGHRTPLKQKKELARTSYFDERRDLPIIRSVALSEKDITILMNEDEVYEIAEEYANSGFQELKRIVLGPGRPIINFASLLLEYAMDRHTPS